MRQRREEEEEERINFGSLRYINVAPLRLACSNRSKWKELLKPPLQGEEALEANITPGASRAPLSMFPGSRRSRSSLLSVSELARNLPWFARCLLVFSVKLAECHGPKFAALLAENVDLHRTA